MALAAARAEERALEVDAEYPVPLVLGHVEKSDPREDAGVVDQQVDTAESFRRGDHGRDVVGPGDVTRHRHGPAAGAANLGGDSLGGLGIVEVVDHHPGTFAAISPRDRRADTLLRAGHHRDPVPQTHLVTSPFHATPASEDKVITIPGPGRAVRAAIPPRTRDCV
jgi:hypothetical protein